MNIYYLDKDKNTKAKTKTKKIAKHLLEKNV